MSMPAARARPTLRQDSDKMLAGKGSKHGKQAAPRVMAAQGEGLIKAFRAAGPPATPTPVSSPAAVSKIPRSPKAPGPAAVNSTTQSAAKALSSPSSKIPRPFSSVTAARQPPTSPAQPATSLSYHPKPCPATAPAVEPCTPTALEAPAPACSAAAAKPSQLRCCSLTSADLEPHFPNSAEAPWLSSSDDDSAAVPAPAAELRAANTTNLGSQLQQHREQQQQQQWRRQCSQELELRVGDGPECSWLSAPLDEVFLLGGCCWLGSRGLQLA